MANTSSDYSDADGGQQDRSRKEQELAGGAMSRGAANRSAPFNSEENSDPTTAADSSGSSSPDNDEHYNKLIDRGGGSAGAATDRDLASVGGGSIPGGNSYGGMNTSDSTVNSGSASAGAAVGGGGSPTDRGSVGDADMRQSPGASNVDHEPQQGNLGGRNPGQSQNQPIGDQDATFGKRSSAEEEVSDPMTSRAPDKVNQRQEGH